MPKTDLRENPAALAPAAADLVELLDQVLASTATLPANGSAEQIRYDLRAFVQRSLERGLRVDDNSARRIKAALLSKPIEPSPKPTREHRVHVRELHNPENGRIDAKKVSQMLGISLAEMSRALGRSRSAVHKTSDATSLQESLGKIERILAALLHLLGDEKEARMWLNAPNRDLANQTPLSFVLGDQAEVVANLLEDALFGQPA